MGKSKIVIVNKQKKTYNREEKQAKILIYIKEDNMHEYPITQQIIKIAEKHCREAEADRVTKVHLVVGEYSGFVGDSIQMYFDVISKDTLCEGALIVIEYIKPKLKCQACGELFVKVPMTFACPKCGEDGGPTEIGKEFYIKEIEVE